jgi:Flp pilus assembly protein TadG
MLRSPPSSTAFAKDQNGTVGILFGFLILSLVIALGLAVDFGRAIITKGEAGNALDAAALATARYMMESNPSDAALNAMAASYFKKNVASNNATGATYDNVQVTIDRANKSLTVAARAHVPTTFTAVMGLRSIPFATSSTATYNVKDIEFGLQLDLTGSMCDATGPGTTDQPCSSATKLNALKTATDNLIDIILPSGGSVNKARIGFAPFTEGVDAGGYANTVLWSS